MFTIMPESSGPVVGVRATGKLTDADYKETLIPALDKLFAAHGTLNVLIYLDDGFEGWELGAAWDDARFGLGHRSDFARLAVVGGPAWVEWGIKACGFLMKGEIRVFPADQLNAAWAWVKG